MRTLVLVILIYFSTFNHLVEANHDIPVQIYVAKYQKYTLYIDCNRKASFAFNYVIDSDTGNETRYGSFYDDINMPSHCKQLSRSSYRLINKNTELSYDRGHLAAANHFDSSKALLKEVNFMSNVLPQTVALNRGAWKRTEELIECYRDLFPVTTLGGVIWGNDSSNDYFVNSHGVETPDYFWRLLSGVNSNGKEFYSACILPNDGSARSSNLVHYEVSHEKLMELVKIRKSKELLRDITVTLGEPFKYSKRCKFYES
ncbi:DNA/RNA non-specific endonuclease [Shewanella sp. 1_MG-2023]|uniref:DNA/RNA non-specific endonuclease n=1 Tax=unclassified Shewanella TaxID=196818 RepID=UPI0026E3D3AD|nr:MULTISPECIES: DNA/RNA non-specific endonuclease [unclassified Shewanella]MDO6613728.1 DNA/RNA non-specific endonuclease [Shewanella sp. 7_MG-2023]MDO6772664.1 DNA/RNA non-specific endonuclease [Shewanella sp. 2_MG-2023]MDO6796532.1 DNA/RNA non-specific endonuclease [Shewanella sp. 1_MG-2023]